MRELNNEKIGIKLRKSREYMSLTQEQVAEILGIGRDAILRIENGKRKISAEELLGFSKLYLVSIDELLHEDVNINYNNQAFARGIENLSKKDQEEILNLIKYKNEINKQ